MIARTTWPRRVLAVWLGLMLAACAQSSPQPAPTGGRPAPAASPTPTRGSPAPFRPIVEPTSAGQTIEVAGLYAVGFEFARFLPCDSGQIWLISWTTSAIIDQYHELKTSDRQPLFVRARGVVGAPSAEDVSLDDYAVLLSEATLLEMREPQPGECE
ncbi:MAG TPA: hypothetical protein VD886_25050 [Herpetosiphonaceae bacterium]|nr:hypothetical protein [Herpetosiphonaceae bacterium]